MQIEWEKGMNWEATDIKSGRQCSNLPNVSIGQQETIEKELNATAIERATQSGA